MTKNEYEKSLLGTYDLTSEGIDISIRECLELELENISFSMSLYLEEGNIAELRHWAQRLADYKAYIMG
jgi:hypothetical protein